MTPKEIKKEITHLRRVMLRGSKTIHRLVDIWTASQARVELLEKRLRGNR